MWVSVINEKLGRRLIINMKPVTYIFNLNNPLAYLTNYQKSFALFYPTFIFYGYAGPYPPSVSIISTLYPLTVSTLAVCKSLQRLLFRIVLSLSSNLYSSKLPWILLIIIFIAVRFTENECRV